MDNRYNNYEFIECLHFVRTRLADTLRNDVYSQSTVSAFMGITL